MHTLFRSITGGLDWANAAEPLANIDWRLAVAELSHVFLFL